MGFARRGNDRRVISGAQEVVEYSATLAKTSIALPVGALLPGSPNLK